MVGQTLFEVGGVILDGTAGYHHASGKRIERGLRLGKPHLVERGVSELVARNLSSKEDIPYSDLQLSTRQWIEGNKRTVRGVTAALPISAPVTVGINLGLTAAQMWTYAVGSYDMATPEIRQYEESLVLSGMTSRVI